jgi:hypothetical protein
MLGYLIIDVAFLRQEWCTVTINLFISFTDSHSVLIVGQWLECATLTRHCSM